MYKHEREQKNIQGVYTVICCARYIVSDQSTYSINCYRAPNCTADLPLPCTNQVGDWLQSIPYHVPGGLLTRQRMNGCHIREMWQVMLPSVSLKREYNL